MAAAQRSIIELPPAGLPTGLRSEDHLNVVGQQQWWERRETGSAQPRSVATALRPRRLKVPYGESGESTLGGGNNGLARGFRKRAGLQNPSSRPAETEYDARYAVPELDHRHVSVSTDPPPAPPPAPVSPPAPAPPVISEYDAKFQTIEALRPHSRVIAHPRPVRSEGPARYELLFGPKPADPTLINQPYAYDPPSRAPEPTDIPRTATEYRKQYAWPAGGSSRTQALGADVGTGVVEADLDPIPPPPKVPFPKTEYQQMFLNPDVVLENVRHVDVGDLGETRVEVREFTPRSNTEGDGEDDDFGYSEEGDGDFTVGGQQHRELEEEDDMQRGYDDADGSGEDDLDDGDRGDDDDGDDDERGALHHLVEQPLSEHGKERNVHDKFATETNDHFQPPSSWQTAAASTALRQSVYAQDFSKNQHWPATSLSKALEEVRERARIYKQRSRRSEISTRLGRLADQQASLLERAGRRHLDLIPQEKKTILIGSNPHGLSGKGARTARTVASSLNTFHDPSAWPSDGPAAFEAPRPATNYPQRANQEPRFPTGSAQLAQATLEKAARRAQKNRPVRRPEWRLEP